jgi:hypothetical protein
MMREIRGILGTGYSRQKRPLNNQEDYHEGQNEKLVPSGMMPVVDE